MAPPVSDRFRLEMRLGRDHDIEEWLYDRGPGNLMATVRFRGGVVQSIRYGAPR